MYPNYIRRSGFTGNLIRNFVEFSLLDPIVKQTDGQKKRKYNLFYLCRMNTNIRKTSRSKRNKMYELHSKSGNSLWQMVKVIR